MRYIAERKTDVRETGVEVIGDVMKRVDRYLKVVMDRTKWKRQIPNYSSDPRLWEKPKKKK